MNAAVNATRAVFGPAEAPRSLVELSDVELEHVVGGLARVRVEDVRTLWAIDAIAKSSAFGERIPA